jgi:hypothetical protein
MRDTQLKFFWPFMFGDCGLYYVMPAAAELQSMRHKGADPYWLTPNFWR